MATEIWAYIGSGRHQAITWTNVDSTSVRSSDIHLRASSQEITQPSITEIIRKIKYLKLDLNFPGANELTPDMLSYTLFQLKLINMKINSMVTQKRILNASFF